MTSFFCSHTIGLAFKAQFCFNSNGYRACHFVQRPSTCVLLHRSTLV